MVVDLTFLVGPGHAQGVVSRLCRARRSTAGLAGMPTGEGRTNRSRTQHLRRRPGQGASDCSLISAPVRTPRPSQPAWRGTYAPRDLQPGHSAKALQWTACCLCVPHAVRHEESAKIDPSKLPWGPNSHLARTVGSGFRGATSRVPAAVSSSVHRTRCCAG